MYKQNYEASAMPTANIAVNKGRIKLYTNGFEMPTYYLQKGQEFEIEIFNPSSEVIMAKIILNGKAISQGGLVLNPGQRVFLDRYFDISKKFLFDTYEVANTSEVKKAIENNGDIKIEFYRELAIIPNLGYFDCSRGFNNGTLGDYDVSGKFTGTPFADYNNPVLGTITTNSGVGVGSSLSTSIDISSLELGMDKTVGMDVLGDTEKPFKQLRSKKSKSIETGRVEQGSHSDQKFKIVNRDFYTFPFHTVEYKMLPISLKTITSDDINVKRYCTNCGSKLGKTDKFCSQCAKKV